ncbi:hypothetical protein [Desulfosoma caldarium]|uniref:hypothetical protein n=1 Tax=Desulfosoma caldarium TaxID=610254 RepID=UPI000F462A13|nr:hypothetical protein [Desulfosoma caldarium]
MMVLILWALAAGWGKNSTAVLGALSFAFGLFAAFGTVMNAHIKERMPSEMSGTALTPLNLFTMLGGAAVLRGLE